MRRTSGAIMVASEVMRGKRFSSSWATLCNAPIPMEMHNSFEKTLSIELRYHVDSLWIQSESGEYCAF
jgi:hypothetical protein